MNKFNKIYIFIYLVFLIAHVAFVWLLPYFPTQDGPSHIYNLVILKDLLGGGSEWGSFFSLQLRATPNLGFTLLSYPLLHFFSPLVVEKLFISIYIVLMGVSVPLFLRTFNQPILPFAYFAFPVLFNFTLLKGFYSFTIAIPLLFITFSLCWKYYNLSGIFKFILYNILGFILFYFHIIPFVLFLITLIVTHIARSADSKRIIIAMIKLFGLTSPIIFKLLLYIVNIKSSLPAAFHYLPFFQHIQLVIELLFFSTVNFFRWQTIPVSLVMFLYVLFTYSSLKKIYKRKIQGENILDSEKFLFLLASALILIYLFAPFRFGGGSLFNERFPWIIFLVLLPLFHIPTTPFWKRFAPLIIACAVLLNFVSNAVALQQQSDKTKQYLSGLHVAIPKGAYVMTYKPHVKAEWSRPFVDVLMHGASYYGIFKGCVDIGNYETGRHYFPVKFKENIPKFPPSVQISYAPETIDWTAYPSIQYLIGWDIDQIGLDKLSQYFHIIWDESPLTIWKRNH